MAEEVDLWELFHNYRRLVAVGKARQLTCPECENILITRLGIQDDLVLWCVGCLKTFKPGLDVIQQVRAVVNEHRL